MLKERGAHQHALEMVTLESLVPSDHLLRQIDTFIDFEFIRDKIPDASTINQNRRRRFVGTTIYQEIFDAIVEQAQSAGLVSGRVLYTDSTYLKASANKNKFDVKEVTVKPQAYLEALDEAVDEDRKAHYVQHHQAHRLSRVQAGSEDLQGLSAVTKMHAKCQRQAIARISLCAPARTRQGEGTVFTGSGLPEHEEDRAGEGP